MIKGSHLMNTFLSSYSKIKGGTGASIMVSGLQLPRASKAGKEMVEIAEVESESKTVGKREDAEDLREETDSDEDDGLGRSPEIVDMR
jgi:hypothetical protein